MSVVEFIPKNPIKPLFAIKLPTIVSKICDFLDDDQRESVLKEALKIDKDRLVELNPVEDADGNKSSILIIFDYKYKLRKPKYDIPQNKNGFFDFKIYDIDFNKNIDMERFIKTEKEFNKKSIY